MHISRGASSVAPELIKTVFHKGSTEGGQALTPEPLGELDQFTKAISAKWDQRLLRLKMLLEGEEVGE